MQKDHYRINKLTFVFKNFFHKIIKLIEFQLLMMLISWPILLYWGLPLSIMAPISNIIFMPFLSLFILISSFIFFTELFSIPNNFLIKTLDILSNIWFFFLKQSTKFWLLPVQYPGLFYLILLILFTLIIIYIKKLRSSLLKILIILIFILFCFIIFKYLNLGPFQKDILIINKSVLFIKKENQNIVIDNLGALNKNISSFVLTSNFIKSGAYKIDYLIILKPSINCFKSVSNLLNVITINNIYIPKFQAYFNQSGWKNWQDLLENIKKYKVNLHLICQNKEIKFENNRLILITLGDKIINKNKLKYNELEVLII